MKSSVCKKLSVAIISSVFALFSMSAFADHYCGSYKDYYLDKYCNVYYMDKYGNKVVTGKYNSWNNTGLSLMKDCHGRWYRTDGFGNRVYMSKRCG